MSLLSPSEDLRQQDSCRTQIVLELLGLSECAQTAFGSESVRGASGGQQVRARVGEALLAQPRLLALDETSSGLDAATTLRIFSELKQACTAAQSSVVAALQQVTPETYARCSTRCCSCAKATWCSRVLARPSQSGSKRPWDSEALQTTATATTEQELQDL